MCVSSSRNNTELQYLNNSSIIRVLHNTLRAVQTCNHNRNKELIFWELWSMISTHTNTCFTILQPTGKKCCCVSSMKSREVRMRCENAVMLASLAASGENGITGKWGWLGLSSDLGHVGITVNLSFCHWQRK